MNDGRVLFQIVEKENLTHNLSEFDTLRPTLSEERNLFKTSKALFRDIIDYCKRSLNNYAANEQLKQISESLMHEVIRWDSTDNSNLFPPSINAKILLDPR